MKRRDFLFDTVYATGLTLSGALLIGGAPAAFSDEKRDSTHRIATGPLRVHPDNRRYFTDGSRKAVYLSGSHTWGSLQDGGVVDSEILFNSTADWISPNPDKYDFRKNPPASDGRKVILLDTDHLWGIGGDRTWVWKSFLRGYNPIWMDPFDRSRNGTSNTWGPVLPADADEVRRNLGYTCGFAKKMNLAAMTPLNDLASSGYCLASPGHEYLVYLPEGGEVTVDLSATVNAFVVEWFDPRSGASRSGASVAGGVRRSFHAPFDNDAVLYLQVPDRKTPRP